MFANWSWRWKAGATLLGFRCVPLKVVASEQDMDRSVTTAITIRIGDGEGERIIRYVSIVLSTITSAKIAAR